jgi:hypothetical protein
MHYDADEGWRRQGEIQRVVQGQLAPGDTFALKDSGSRIGDADRERAQAHLGNMYADGRLTAEETEKRRAFIATAETRQQLTQILDDLPPYPQPAGKTEWETPILVAGIIGGLLLAVLPLTCLSAAHAGGPGAAAVIAITFILGLALSAVSSVVLAVRKTSG